MYLRALNILKDELQNSKVQEEFTSKLSVYFKEEALAFREEQDKDYLSQDDLEQIGIQASERFAKDITTGKFTK